MFHSAHARPVRRVRSVFALAFALIAMLAAIASSAQAASPDGDPFYTTPELCKLTLTPTNAEVQVGGSQTLTAKLESTGVTPPWVDSEYTPPCYAPVWTDGVSEGELGVNFKALSGPNAGLSESHSLDTSFTATHTYSSQLAGTDIWQATIDLPEECRVDWESLPSWDGQPVPDECLDRVECTTDGNLDYDCDDESVDCNTSISEVCPASNTQSQVSPTVTLTSNDSAIIWVSLPAPPVEIQRDPSVSIAASKRCHTPNKFRVRPSTANGQVASMTLYVDGKKIRTVKGSSEAFTINGAQYGPGSHSIKLVTSFTNGKKVTTKITFNRCKARSVAKRTEPRFTG